MIGTDRFRNTPAAMARAPRHSSRACSSLAQIIQRYSPLSRLTRTHCCLIRVVCCLLLLGGYPQLSHAEELITFEDIKLISPRASDDFARAIIDARAEMEAAGISTRLRMAHFIAQIMTETGGLRRIDENMNYSEASLLRVFSRRTVSKSKAQEIARKPREVANWVYGSRLGNQGRDTDDGWNYRGSGFIQLTGRANFRDRGSEIGLELEANPELARQAREGILAAIAYWTARNINRVADDNDRRRVRVLVNGPRAHGYDQAIYWFNQAWKTVFLAKESDGFETGVDVQEAESTLFDNIMTNSGLLPGDFSGSGAESGVDREQALIDFQREQELPESGTLDLDTRYALLDPREWRHLDTEESSSTGGRASPASVQEFETSAVFNLRASLPAAPTAVDLIEPSEGSGATESNATAPLAVQSQLRSASATYASYEMGDQAATPELFKPFSIVGTDDRVAVPNTTLYPSRAVVQILYEASPGNEKVCSGAMISKDTVLTAAHCVLNRSAQGRYYTKVRVIPGRNKLAFPFGSCEARKSYVLNGWTHLSNSEYRQYDLGAYKLDCDIGLRTGWFGVRSLADSELNLPSSVHGYSADRAPTGRQWVSLDKIHLMWELKGFYENDTFGGTSGSPVYTENQNNILFGVHTNGLHGEFPWNKFNSFTRITRNRLGVIQQWIEDQ